MPSIYLSIYLSTSLSGGREGMRGVCVVFLVGLEDHDIGEKMERKKTAAQFWIILK